MLPSLKAAADLITGKSGKLADAKDPVPYSGPKSIPEPDKITGDTPHFKLYWLPTTINKEAWNQAYPYQLLIVKEEAPGKDGGLPQFSRTQWEFTLPIPPEDLSISMPFASEVHQTLGGRPVEEHAGAPFRMISFSGTTGVAPGRRTAETAGFVKKGTELVTGVLAGSITPAIGGALQKVARAAESFANGAPKRQVNIHDINPTGLTVNETDQRGIPFNQTGFWQFHALERFLEMYAKMKTKGDAESRKLRLAFAIWKDNHTYLVTPMRFEMKRQADRPYEYMYSIQFKAWARIPPQGNASPYAKHTPAVREPGILNKLFNDLNNAAILLQSIEDVAKAAVADFSRILSITRLTMNVVKSAGNLALTVSDMPSAFRESLERNIDETKGAWEQSKNAFKVAFGVIPKTQEISGGKKNTERFKPSTQVFTANGSTGSADDEGDSRQDAKDALKDPKVASKLRLAGLPLNATMRKIIQEEKDKAKATTRADLEARRDEVNNIAADYADQIGLGNATFNAIYGRKSQATEGRVPTNDEVRALWAMQNVAQSLDRLSASLVIDDDKRPSSLEFIAGLAAKSDITFELPNSKFLVPVPYGVTLEQISRTYLGDALRWHELAALNHLRAPYIDEEGFSYPLLTNPDVRTVTVASADDLVLGKPIWIGSKTKVAIKRKIERIDVIAPGYVMITVDGDTELDAYHVSDEAYVHAFKPGTVNSQMLMYIPSLEVPPPNLSPKPVPGVTDDGFLDVGGVDLLLNPSGDLVIGPEGDLRYAFGLTNIVQTARIIIGTPRGSLLLHPDFGLGIKPGTSTADVDTSGLFTALQETFTNDPMFTGLSSASIEKSGPMTSLAITVSVRGSANPVPISVNLNV